MAKFCCLIVIILCTARLSKGERLTEKCLASNGICGTKDLTCNDSFGSRWINEGRCCYERPCCKINGYSCGFETDAPCIFQDSTKDEFDWKRLANSTSSPKTGPTNAAEGNYYIYIEVTDKNDGDKAILTTEAASLPASSWCLTFQYHMKGKDMGNLEVFAGDKTSNLTSIWEKTGDQPDPDLWKSAIITIPQYTNSVITIEGSRGTTAFGDIAIDDLTLNAGTCSAIN
ncbi:MAM domain-containing glycosylphosphatidylinositol anchor protein 1-like [Mytilus californianus]|uniref:MAM domain-containing glycosylphosphatidylinositol anchor protein 1-like n=1 Tax=Mytilus californianus TaxID=6549 RepID=UPI002245F2CB|nr:MAM domain-containing glycosylphosphatidylinositol anchor protein 1-like [Mytilus californianus]